MAKKKVLILGAGLAGLSAAWHLQKKGYACRIFEQEDEPGGLCRSKKIKGFTFDYDGHLLHFKGGYALHLIRNLLGVKIVRHRRSAWIYSFGSFSRYPFQANLYNLPKPVVKDCLLGFLKLQGNGAKIKERLSFRHWIEQAFGRGIARHFMIPYNTKFWGLPLDELSCEWVDGLIPVPGLNRVIDGVIRESRQNLGYNACFWYPQRGGIGEVPRAFSSQVNNINRGCKVTGIDLKRKKISINRGQGEKFDLLISTIALPQMHGLLRGAPPDLRASFEKLRWNSVFNLNLGLEKRAEDLRHWVYFPEKNFSFFRVGFPHNFSSYITPGGKGSLYAEASYSERKPIDKDNIRARIRQDLRKAGILNGDEAACVEDINDIKYAYPVYDHNYRQARGRIIRFLLQNNIIPCGRYGSWRYLSMEDVILDGRDAAARVLSGNGHG